MKGILPTTLADIYDEIGDALEEVPGLRVGVWGEVPNIPGAFLSLPRSVQPSTYGSVGLTDVPVTVLVGRAVHRQALKDVMRLTGEVAAVIEPRSWETCSGVSITSVEYDTVTVAGAPDVFLAAIFHLDIEGP